MPSACGPAGVDREVAAQRQLLQAHQPRALARRQADPGLQRRLVLGRVGTPALLHRGDPKRRPPRRALARRRGVRRGGHQQTDLTHGRDFRPSIAFPAEAAGTVYVVFRHQVWSATDGHVVKRAQNDRT